MRIAFNSILLAADDGFLCTPRGLGLNGQVLVQPVEYPRALYTQFLARGNRSVDFTFAVERFFDSAGDAAFFELTHQNDLPDTASLIVQCGDDSSLNVKLPGAVVQAVGFAAGSLVGKSLVVTYRFLGGAFSATADIIAGGPDDQTSYYPEWGLFMKKGIITLITGQTSVVVNFDNAASSNPVVSKNIDPPAGGSPIACSLDGNATTGGFTVKFDAPIPGPGYVLSWSALY